MTLQERKSTFGFETPEESPGFLLWQTTITWQRLIKKALDGHDISHAQFVIMAVSLWLEEHHQDPTQVAIARLSKLDKMTISTSLKKLVLQGYISRKESQKDTRAKWVSLTPTGKILMSTLVPLVEGIDKEFFRCLGSDDHQKLNQLLNKIVG